MLGDYFRHVQNIAEARKRLYVFNRPYDDNTLTF